MFYRHFALIALLTCSLATVACGGANDTTDTGAGTSQDELGKTRFHFTPNVTGVTFHGGCGLATNPPPKDCFYGFGVDYTKAYIDLTTTVTDAVDNNAHTLRITVDTWSYSHIHSHVVPGEDVQNLGMAGAKVGVPYAVTVVDRNANVLWTGTVNTLFHL